MMKGDLKTYIKRRGSVLLGLTLMFMQTACSEEEPLVSTEEPTVEIKTILTGYEIIWGMDFLPNGDLIFGEKRGKLYLRKNETVTEITGFPAVFSSGQGGLLDIRVHPDYADNGWVYASYSAANTGSGSQLKLVRFKVINNQVQNIENIFSTGGSNTWSGHYGSRIAFDKKNRLYLSVGEGGSTSYGGANTGNNNAQDPKSNWGKIHRLTDTGGVPADNPVIPGNTAPTSIYSYGHRNPQGLARHPGTGDIWATEHGPKGGDEINIITKGSNYGWPAYSIGVNYDGTTISASHTATGITSPLYTWTPSIGICGMVFINSDRFKAWNGDLLISGLASQKLYRCVVDESGVIEEHVLLSGYGRIRNVVEAPDGSVYVSVEGPGRILQLMPN
ncbi:MAG: PQQ-dependent sugar dehydrogenase [Bacteroidales bacterium]|jgi:glucose/arabinose dehydrogenase|nr:PQQ-dependent sugar dehydrogenase [Bacteroidales bacterium]